MIFKGQAVWFLPNLYNPSFFAVQKGGKLEKGGPWNQVICWNKTLPQSPDKHIGLKFELSMASKPNNSGDSLDI